MFLRKCIIINTLINFGTATYRLIGERIAGEDSSLELITHHTKVLLEIMGGAELSHEGKKLTQRTRWIQVLSHLQEGVLA